MDSIDDTEDTYIRQGNVSFSNKIIMNKGANTGHQLDTEGNNIANTEGQGDGYQDSLNGEKYMA